MEDPLLDYSYKKLPESTSDLTLLQINSNDEHMSTTTSTLPKNDHYEKLLETIKVEMSKYEKELEDIRKAAVNIKSMPTTVAIVNEDADVKLHINRLETRIQSLLEQNAELIKENNLLKVKNDGKSEIPPSVTQEVIDKHELTEKFGEMLRLMMDELNSKSIMDSDVRGLIRKYATILPIKLETYTEFTLSLWKHLLLNLQKPQPEDKSHLVDSLQNEVSTLKEKLQELRIINESLQKQQLNAQKHRTIPNPNFIIDLDTEIAKKNQMENLIDKIKVLLADKNYNKTDLVSLMERIAKEVSNSSHVQKLLATIKSDMKNANDNDDEDGLSDDGLNDQLTYLQQTIDEHVQVSAKLKQENVKMMEENEMIKEKMELREKAWIEKFKEFEQKIRDLKMEEGKLKKILQNYVHQFDRVLALTPEKGVLDPGEVVGHPLPFIKHMELLHGCLQSTHHTLERLKEAKTILQKQIQQEKLHSESLAQDLRVSSTRIKQGDNDTKVIESKLNSLQHAVRELSEQLEQVTQERDMLETKLMRVGEGFFKIMSV